jgi:hypothetical protein
VEASLWVYRELRQAAREMLAQVHSKGYTAVRAVGRDEVMEVFLTDVPGRRLAGRKDILAPAPGGMVEGAGFVLEWAFASPSPVLHIEEIHAQTRI